jgi:hypothetical protein
VPLTGKQRYELPVPQSVVRDVRALAQDVAALRVRPQADNHPVLSSLPTISGFLRSIDHYDPGAVTGLLVDDDAVTRGRHERC